MPSSIRRVFVTGASGKLGAPLCEALVQAGYQVRALCHRYGVGVPGVDEVRGDVADAGLIEELVDSSDAVIHLATCKEDREALIKVSVQGTFNLLDAAMRSKATKRVILASGDAVNGIYFHPQPVPIREDMPLAAYPGYYPLSKVLEEAMFQQYFVQAGVPTVCLRISWIHAEDDILNHLTVAGECFGIPVWKELMNEQQRDVLRRPRRGRRPATSRRPPDAAAHRGGGGLYSVVLAGLGTRGNRGPHVHDRHDRSVRLRGCRRLCGSTTGDRRGRTGGPRRTGLLHRHDQGTLPARLPAAIRHPSFDRSGCRVPPGRSATTTTFGIPGLRFYP